jgi:transketolase
MTTSQRELANAIRALAMDAVQLAQSGHAGAPMGMADIAEVLWRRVLKYNPGNPRWINRDRFVLSNGHASILLYAVAYLTGYPLGMEEIKNFRQLGSRTPGHPERDLDIGVETTTGPLGQGLANAVGMATAEKLLAREFNRPGFSVVDHHTYVFMGDGCLMEGISHEACSFAGTFELGKLIGFYDDNGISIDGSVKGWFLDDTPKRFAAYGWHVIPDVNGEDAAAVAAAVRAARAEEKRPSLICCKTIIGYGSPNKQGTKAAHSDPLGTDEVALVRQILNWPYPPFEIPEAIRAAWDHRAAGAAAERAWNELFARYRGQFPELATELERRMRGDLPKNWKEIASQARAASLKETKAKATRASSQDTLNAIGPSVPELLGGSADLTGSNNTQQKNTTAVTPEDFSGHYFHYGVREFGMTAIMNGMAAHGGYIPYGGTFLTFSDYARNAVRLAALMELRVILVYTHDSIGLGEDGPTHQPIEHLTSLRAIPHMSLWRPCDGFETAVAWVAAVERAQGPTSLALTRQALPPQTRTPEQQAAVARGGYVLIECAGTAEAIVIATGSEVGIAAQAVKSLNDRGRKVRLVSMPCTDAFDAQDAAYREAVLPKAVVRRLAVEAGATLGWWHYVGLSGQVLGIDRFGASGKGPAVFAHFGFTADNIVSKVEELLKG